MPYPFLGNSTRVYVQFWDLDADTPLTADPGQSYNMTPVAGWDLLVPPGDGRWGPFTEPSPPKAEEPAEVPAEEPGEEPAAEPEPDLPPVPLINAPAETEEN